MMKHRETESPVVTSCTEITNDAARDFFSCSIPCNIDSVRGAVREAGDFIKAHGATDDEITGCELAIAEACNNAVLYVNDEKRDLPIGLQICKQADCLEIHVIDHTPGFDWPAQISLPGVEIERGRGLFIIRGIMDTAYYLRGEFENRLVMRKRLNHSAQVSDTEVQTEKNSNSTGRAPSSSAHRPAHKIVSTQDSVHAIQKQLALSQHVIKAMAEELCQQIISSRLHKEELDNRLLSRELEIARNIQQSLLPSTFPAIPGFSIGGHCVSARQVGGDFYDVLPLADGSALLAVADVMGKGVPAALFAATLRTLLRTTAEWTSSPGEILARVNRLIYDELSAVDMFITAQLLVVNQNQMTLASAGHCPLLYLDNTGEATACAPDGMPLGIVKECNFAEETIPLENMSCVLLYTDGLTEARNANGALFGEKRLIDWLKTGIRSQHSPAELTQSFLKEMASFQSSDSIKDDQTFLVLTRLPSIPAISNTMPPMLKSFAELNLQASKA